MNHVHDLDIVVHREEDAVDVRFSTIARHADGKPRVEALRRYGTTLRVLVQRQGRTFEIGLGAPGDLNPACHAGAAAG